MKLLIVSLLLLGCALAISWRDEIVQDFEKLEHKKHFLKWKKTFKRTYKNPEEEALRLKTFIKNWRKINKHNSNKLYNWTMGLNQFADLNAEQFRLYIHGHNGACVRTRPIQKKKYASPAKSLISFVPDSIDWTTKGVVTPVKNQGQCGSCWAFSTTGSVESRSAIKTGKLVSLSEQQLIDCSRRDGNLGCNGGLMDDAFKYVKSEGGLCTEAEYPYEARDGLCRAASCGTKYDPITGYTDVTADNTDDLKDAVAAGPVSIAVEADQSSWQFYKSGVMTGLCGTKLDHGVLAVGYGTEGSNEYWKVKNSWGKTWGMEGYLLICRNCGKNGKQGECGILKEPSFPLV